MAFRYRGKDKARLGAPKQTRDKQIVVNDRSHGGAALLLPHQFQPESPRKTSVHREGNAIP